MFHHYYTDFRSVSKSDTATTLTGLHFGTTTLLTTFLTWLGYIQPSQLPWPDLLKFVLFANFSIVGMNVSLMWNSVGFYQVSPFFNLHANFVSFKCNLVSEDLETTVLEFADCQAEYDPGFLSSRSCS